MKYTRMPIEIESPESLGYDTIECNLAESSVRDVSFREMKIDLGNLIIAYGDHIGNPALRGLIASLYPGIENDQVLLTVGAAGALFMIHTTLLSSGDHLVVVRPNYGTNIETPRAIGASISFIDLHFEDGFGLDLNEVKKAIKPNTRLVSITTPHNPTGVSLSAETIHSLCKLAESANCFLLVDETYRDLSFNPPAPLAASMSDRAISVSSVSKAYGIPGLRLGWVISRNKSLLEKLLAAKEQIHICNSVVDEEICYQYLLKKNDYFGGIQTMVRNNFHFLEVWISNHPYLEWVKPSGGVVCFPRFRKDAGIDPSNFYSRLLHDHKTYVGPGHWFEQSKEFFRLGFGWETESVFRKGIANIDLAITKCQG
jgi:aspartate/methionine/tyrosine aminotransferase